MTVTCHMCQRVSESDAGWLKMKHNGVAVHRCPKCNSRQSVTVESCHTLGTSAAKVARAQQRGRFNGGSTQRLKHAKNLGAT